jgi:predicted phage terminase large subunit-like protein
MSEKTFEQKLQAHLAASNADLAAWNRTWWRSTPALMAKHLTSGAYKTPPHIKLLADELAEAFHQKDYRLIVTLPPRHGKSEIVSHWFPVWCLMMAPQARIILSSYEADFAASWGRKVRDDIVKHEPLINVKLKKDTTAANRWETEQGGGMLSSGVGGQITGRGADFLIIDDPIKGSEEAYSEVMREKAWQWFKTVAYTRLEPEGSAIVIMTRWHEDDLVGRLVSQMNAGGEPWRVVNLPALAEADDPLGRRPGEALWPERYDEKTLAVIKSTMGSRDFTALHQQRPTPAGGGIFKREWIKYYEDMGDHYLLHMPQGVDKRIQKDQCWRFMTADTAFTTRSQSDYTVVQVWDVTREGNYMILVDQWRDQQEAPVVEDTMISMQRRFEPLFLGIEDKMSGSVALQRFKRDGLTVKSLKADRDKINRAVPSSIWMENGKVYFDEHADYLSAVEAELLGFPNAKHDDIVDAMAYAVAFASQHNLWVNPPPPKLPPMSYGALLGHDKIWNRSGNKSARAFALDREKDNMTPEERLIVSP